MTAALRMDELPSHTSEPVTQPPSTPQPAGQQVALRLVAAPSCSALEDRPSAPIDVGLDDEPGTGSSSAVPDAASDAVDVRDQLGAPCFQFTSLV